ncbi:hypothetical protein Fmac_008156 [Flemingia macrophylla]|uniref:Uncharacterized protein n=1 Tax=Flemingia macrophylla TaxID=520843 RepID=A0ABD1MX50_9FABA
MKRKMGSRRVQWEKTKKTSKLEGDAKVMQRQAKGHPLLMDAKVPKEPFRRVTSVLIIELSHRFVALHAIGSQRDLKTFLIENWQKNKFRRLALGSQPLALGRRDFSA